MKIQPLNNGFIKLYQPHMIDQIIKDLGFVEGKVKHTAIPVATTVRLDRDLNGARFQEEWDYRTVIWKLNFLENST